ncbi:hypothetical protein [Deinococcus sonorensis]|uniref:ABM domain-containing protein n=2 Tax=Deinococcus sonorensis TaxID=309891 RepID=A0AAU7U6D4_9DEIO
MQGLGDPLWSAEVYSPDSQDLLHDLGRWESAAAARAACFQYAGEALQWTQMEDGELWARGPQWWFRVFQARALN